MAKSDPKEPSTLMPQPTCRHVHANGALCKSPPLRNRDYCHFHLDQIGRQLRAARSRARHLPSRLKLPLLEDPFAVQVALMQMADAITYNEIDVQRGRLLMSVLRLASRNLTAARAWKHDALFVAEGDAETEWSSFEQENELPQDFDLSLDPELAFPSSHENESVPHTSWGWNVWRTTATDHLEGCTRAVLRARIRQALAEAEPSAPAVTADQVELMDIYERQGEKAATKFADQMVRNDRRRERRVERAHYEELARQHNIRIAARKLIEEQQRQAGAASAPANAQEAGADAAAVPGQSLRKQPVSAAAVHSSADASPGSDTA